MKSADPESTRSFKSARYDLAFGYEGVGLYRAPFDTMLTCRVDGKLAGSSPRSGISARLMSTQPRLSFPKQVPLLLTILGFIVVASCHLPPSPTFRVDRVPWGPPRRCSPIEDFTNGPRGSGKT
jgi:hypothetical protein